MGGLCTYQSVALQFLVYEPCSRLSSVYHPIRIKTTRCSGIFPAFATQLLRILFLEAEELCIPYTTYVGYEKGVREPPMELLVRMARLFGVSVDTKSALITRDIDVLSAIGAAGGAIAKITVTTADDQLARIIEPHAPSPSERFAALAELADAGVFCGVLFTPTLPFVTDDDATVRGVVEGAAAAGARFVYHMTGVTMRDRQRDHFLDRIAAVDPTLPERYRAAFGDRYFCNSPRATENRALFRSLCKQHGLLWRMSDIIAAYKPSQPMGAQTSLF